MEMEMRLVYGIKVSGLQNKKELEDAFSGVIGEDSDFKISSDSYDNIIVGFAASTEFKVGDSLNMNVLVDKMLFAKEKFSNVESILLSILSEYNRKEKVYPEIIVIN